MTERWKPWKTKSRFPTVPTVPWKSPRRREIPTFPQFRAVLFAQRENCILLLWAVEKCKSKRGISTFPPPREPLLFLVITAPRWSTQNVNPRFLQPVCARPLWCLAKQILQRPFLLVQPFLPKPHVQLSIQLMRQLHLLARVALLPFLPRQLDGSRPELNGVILPHRPVVLQAEQPVPVSNFRKSLSVSLAGLANRLL